MHARDRCGGDAELQEPEPPCRRTSAREERDDQRAAERHAEQVDPEHGRERVDGRTEHETEQTDPCELQQQRGEAAESEESRHDRARGSWKHGGDRGLALVLARSA